MIRIDVTLPVNDPAEPDQYKLDRDQLWAGLLRKAENAVPFIVGMTECTVLERRQDGLAREVVVRGERIHEEVVFEPRRRVSFHREDDRAVWVIHNLIAEDEAGALTLTFASEASFGGEPGAAEQKDLDRMRTSMRETVRNTLDLIRGSAGA